VRMAEIEEERQAKLEAEVSDCERCMVVIV
jgi:hypothetical protein